MSTKKIAIGGDHAGYELKQKVIAWLEELEYSVQDFGPFAPDSVDYPDFAHPLSNDVEKGSSDLGILICGSGNGVAITANKHSGIRAALCWLPEISALARAHNNANVLCIPARFVSEDVAKEIVKQFLNTPFEGGRHQNRVNKITC